eukprot:GHVS01090764.1.p1 GENE.GHVS01090764.1~~GHVS01090764.1.p1  ORF type:complete len:247 (+),score=37.73 GHVS01090764.1:170-910(+)
MSLSPPISTPRQGLFSSDVTLGRGGGGGIVSCHVNHGSPRSSNHSTASNPERMAAKRRTGSITALTVVPHSSCANGGPPPDSPADRQSVSTSHDQSIDGSPSSRSTLLARSSSTRSSGNEASKEMNAAPTDSESSVTNSSVQATIAVENDHFIESPTSHIAGWTSPGYNRHRRPHFNELRSRIQYLERENVRLATQRHDLDMKLNSLQAQYDHLRGRAPDVVIEAPPSDPVCQGCCVSSSGICFMQ